MVKKGLAGGTKLMVFYLTCFPVPARKIKFLTNLLRQRTSFLMKQGLIIKQLAGEPGIVVGFVFRFKSISVTGQCIIIKIAKNSRATYTLPLKLRFAFCYGLIAAGPSYKACAFIKI